MSGELDRCVLGALRDFQVLVIDTLLCNFGYTQLKSVAVENMVVLL